MKEAIIKSVAAIICLAIVCLTLASMAATYCETELKAAEIAASNTPSADNSNNSYYSSANSDSSTSDTVSPEDDSSVIITPDPGHADVGVADSGTNTSKSVNPEEWSIERIVEEYKKAAKNTHAGTKSQHKIKIEKIKVNGNEFDGITNLMDKLLANNSEDKDGITGGYENLSVNDVKAAKAYKTGNNTVIEMDMKDQTSGPSESDKSGSVGHAVTVVGDISSVTKQITDLGFPLEINEKETVIEYTKATVRVVINENGKIINGSWQYTVEIKLNNYTVMKNIHVDSTSILMTNTLTVGGGFKK